MPIPSGSTSTPPSHAFTAAIEVSVASGIEPSGLSFDRTIASSRVVFGAHRLGELHGELDALGIKRALLICSSRQPMLRDAVREAGGDRVEMIFEEIRPHVPVALVEKSVGLLQEVDGIVTAGGGSAIGLGKALVARSVLPLVAIPTTYSGSEMTSVFGTTVDGEKTTARNPAVLPRTVIYDPELLVGLPDAIAVPSALNAFAHCVEALYADRCEPVTSLIALEGARIITAALARDGAKEPMQRCTQLLLGAHLGGSAFGAVGGSVHHTLCHILGGRHDLPHAETHAAVLPQVLAVLAPEIPFALAQLGAALGVKAEAVPAFCFDQVVTSGCRTDLEGLGLPESDVPSVAALLAQRTSGTHHHLDPTLASRLLWAAFRGERPAN